MLPSPAEDSAGSATDFRYGRMVVAPACPPGSASKSGGVMGLP